MLRCPVCHHREMVILELDAIEVDYCISCGGVWLDAGEIGLLLNDPEKEDLMNRLFTDVSEGCSEEKRPCPICETLMRKCSSEEMIPGLVLDRCPRGHGLWFDAGELQRLLECAECGTGSRIISLVRNLFSTKTSTHRGG